MCFGGAATPAAPPPPVAPPAPPKATDPAVVKAKKRSRAVAALAEGIKGTREGGQLVGDPRNQSRKTLLGV